MRIPKDMLEDIDGVILRTDHSRNELLSTFIEYFLENPEIDKDANRIK